MAGRKLKKRFTIVNKKTGKKKTFRVGGVRLKLPRGSDVRRVAQKRSKA
jgi:hypothetical protein